MSQVTIQGNASGNGTLTIAAPNTSTNYTLTLPAETGTVLTGSGAIGVNASAPSNSIAIDSSGNVGVGTSSPGSTLNLQAASCSIRLKDTGASDYALIGTDDDGSLSLYARTAAGIVDFRTNNTERMRITSGGNFNISSSSTVYFAGATSAAQIETGAVNAAFMSGSGVLEFGSNTTSNRNIQEFYNPNGNVGKIATNGSSTAFTTSSDYRLKENVTPMTGALATVAQLNPVNWTWKADGSAGQGFIAHELQAVVPDCVAGEKDAVQTYVDDEGVEQTRPVYQGVDTSFLVATLTAAIKELKAELDAAKERIAALEGGA